MTNWGDLLGWGSPVGWGAFLFGLGSFLHPRKWMGKKK